MKKSLFLMLALLGIMVSMSSCSSDDAVEDAPSLKNTIWVNEEDGYNEISFGTVSFQWKHVEDNETESGFGGYTYYDPPLVKLTYLGSELGKEVTVFARVDGDKLIFDDVIYTKKGILYTKK
ncbi:hypothetical protein [Hoylesella enoeca]|uniref:Lipocalin-like domain-containing protein n=1 Tax=Hoylesella enoeca TaxID=76123 RepID=A0A0S2KKC5_9BACT|nr:hypothetical protein [Hoylesella enoeca]ALO48753.1 hypothetical protein AS203_06390 [Hoylesella enoeca]